MNNKILAWAAFIAAVVLAFTGLFTPPQGEIDSSVSMVIAQFLLLCATLLGIKSYAEYLFYKPKNKDN